MYHPCQHNILLKKILENIPFFYVQNVFTIAEIKINILVYVQHIDQYSPIVISLFFLFSGNLILSQPEHNQQFRKKKWTMWGKKDYFYAMVLYSVGGKKKKTICQVKALTHLQGTSQVQFFPPGSAFHFYGIY